MKTALYLTKILLKNGFTDLTTKRSKREKQSSSPATLIIVFVVLIGMVAAPSANLVNPGKPLNNDGTVSETTGGKIASYLLESKYMFVDLILKSQNWENYQDNKVIMCLYILENGSVGYICDGDTVTDTAASFSYAEIKGSLS